MPRKASTDELIDAIKSGDRPFWTLNDLSERLDVSRETVRQRMEVVEEHERVQRESVGRAYVYWWDGNASTDHPEAFRVNGILTADDEDERPEPVGIIGRVSGWLSDLFATDGGTPEYDHEYLQERGYRWIEVFATVDGDEYVRCNLCGKLFDPDDVERAVDHVAADLDKSFSNNHVFERSALEQMTPERPPESQHGNGLNRDRPTAFDGVNDDE